MGTQSRKVNSMRNMVVGTINQVSTLFLSTVLTTVFIKKLGTEYLGVNGLFSNIFVLISVAELGIGTVMVYSLYEPLAKGDTKKITSIYRFFKKIYITMSLITTLIVILFIPLLKYIVKTALPINNIAIYYLLFLISMIIYNTFAYKTNLLIADQKRYIVGLYKIFFNTIAVVLQIIYLIYTSNYLHFLLISLINNIVFSFWTSRKVNLVYPFIKDKAKDNQISQKEKGQILIRIKEVFSYNFAQSMLTGTDNIIISMLLGTVLVGYYSNYNAIITGVVSMVETVYTSISASIGNLIVEQKNENHYKIFKLTEVINFWISGFTTTCLFILIQDFIILWLGKKYTFDFKILIILLCNYYLTCTRNSIKIFREASGLFEKVKIAMIFAAVINIFLSLVLGKIFGVFGVFLATSIAVLTTYYWYEAKLLMENKFGGSLKTYLKGEIKGLFLTITSIVITSLCVSWIKEVTIGTFLIKMCICLIVPNIFYFIVLRREEGFQQVFNMMLKSYKKIIK